MNRLLNHEAVYRTAPATPGLLNTVGLGEMRHGSGRNPSPVETGFCFYWWS